MASILVVEDSEFMKQMLCSELGEAGYKVMGAANGLDALNEAKSSTYDLIISDINMPEMDGVSLTRELRSLPEYMDTPIILLTSESNHNTKQSSKAAGASGLIVKPFNPQALLATVDKALKKIAN